MFADETNAWTGAQAIIDAIEAPRIPNAIWRGEEHGLTIDGSTDDQRALQEAVNELPLACGGEVPPLSRNVYIDNAQAQFASGIGIYIDGHVYRPASNINIFQARMQEAHHQ